MNRIAFFLAAMTLSWTATAQHSTKETQEDIARHRAMATAHDLDHGQARHLLVGRGSGHQPQPAPALVLAQEVGQQHHHPTVGLVTRRPGLDARLARQ